MEVLPEMVERGIDTAIILAGGLGTRLRPLTDETPKPLLPMLGKPILQHIIENCVRQGIRNIILSICYKHNKVQEFFSDGSRYGANITYSIEEEPLGTGGAIKKASSNLTQPFIALNGDNLADFNYKELVQTHQKNQTKITLALFPVDDVTQYGIARLEGEKIMTFIEKPTVEKAPSNLNNAGCYVFESGALSCLPEGVSSIERDCFEKLAPQAEISSYIHRSQWFPTDTLEKYQQACINFLPNINLAEKEIIITDVDETICETNQEMALEMTEVLHALIDKGVTFAVISGTDVKELQRMVSSRLKREHHILATTGTNYTHMKNVPETKYNYSLTEEDKVELREVGKLMLEQFNIPHLSNREDQIIDRNSQITYSVIGRTADLEVKKKFDPDSEKRREWVKFLKEHLPQEKYDFRIGGTTSIDITLKGRTKEWGIRQFAAFNKIPLNKIIYLGDKIYPGGNDYEASKIVDCIAVKDHHDALVKMREISMKIKKL